MAKVLGDSGRYVSDQAVAKGRKVWLLSILVIAVFSIIEGLILGRWLLPAKVSPSVSIPIMLGLLAVMLWLHKWASHKMDILEKTRSAMQRGATGEIAVGFVLERLPDAFYVINDLTTRFGNLDHVVVGSTGVFIIDTKSWRGIVAADGKGELLLNGKRTDKPCIRPFVGRIMGIREKVTLLASSRDVYYGPVLVFTAAKVEAKWGTTGTANCIRDDQLYDYIVDAKGGDKLDADEAERIAQAFFGPCTHGQGFWSKRECCCSHDCRQQRNYY
jgi:hypothetical protein